jgi:hypothetical protein
VQSGAKVMNNNNYKILSIYELNNILCINDEMCKVFNLECYNSEEYIKKIYKKDYIDNFTRLKYYLGMKMLIIG